MTRDPLKISELKQRFAMAHQVTAKELLVFYKSHDVILTENTFRSRIFRLVKMGVLQRIGHRSYRFGEQTIFIPRISSLTKKIFSIIEGRFPFASTCTWHTSSLNEFMTHQPFRSNLIVEAEKQAAESVFYFLSEKYRNVYLNPGVEIFHNYISGKKDAIIIKNLISESPTQEFRNVITPTIEKILVDIFCDKIIYSAFQGKEMQNIFENAFEKYTINQSTLSRYALRRGKGQEIDEYIAQLKLGVVH